MCGCGKKKPDNSLANDAEGYRSRGVSNQKIVEEITKSSDDFFPAIYNGPEYPHYIPSSTGIISQYGILNYGMGRKGTKFNVHKDDFEKSKGRLYLPVPLEEGELEMANKGNEGIRGPEPIAPYVFSTEADSNRKANEAAAKAERVSKRAQAKANNDLVALAKEEGKDDNEQAVETKEAVPSDEAIAKALDDVDGDAVPDAQQRVNWNSKQPTDKPVAKPKTDKK